LSWVIIGPVHEREVVPSTARPPGQFHRNPASSAGL
jgi:hypothetical protein